MTSVRQTTDRAGKNRRGGGYVKVDRRAGQLLRWWIDLHDDSTPLAAMTFTEMRLRADWRTGFVAGSDSDLADELGLSRNSFRKHCDVLAHLGLLVRVGKAKNAATGDAGWQVPEDVEAWMRDGEPLPDLLLGLLLLFVPEARTCARTEQHLRKKSAAPAQEMSSTCARNEQADPLSPGETGSVEVEEVKNLQEALAGLRADDPSLVAEVLDALSACLGEKITANDTTTG